MACRQVPGEIDGRSVAGRDDGAPDAPRRRPRPGPAAKVGHRVVVAVRLVGLEHRELRRVRRVDALVAEGPADLVDPLDTADHGLLEVELQRDTQQHLLVERVEPGCGTAARPPRRWSAAGPASRPRRTHARRGSPAATAARRLGCAPCRAPRVARSCRRTAAAPAPRRTAAGARSAAAAAPSRRSASVCAWMESSPRRLVTTSPRTARWSPMSTNDLNSASDSSPTSASESITWSSVPSPSRSRTKQSLPVLRRKITRPVTATSTPVWWSGPSCSASYVDDHLAQRVRAVDVDRVRLMAGRQQPLTLVPTNPHLLGQRRCRTRRQPAPDQRVRLASLGWSRAVGHARKAIGWPLAVSIGDIWTRRASGVAVERRSAARAA